MKKSLLVPVLCLVLTACTAGLGAEPVVEDDPLIINGIDAVTQAIEAWDAENAVPYKAFVAPDILMEEPASEEKLENYVSDPQYPIASELTFQEAANLAESYRRLLGWPDLHPDDAFWYILYVPADYGEIVKALDYFSSIHGEVVNIRPFFLVRYQDIRKNSHLFLLDSVTGTVLQMEANSTPAFLNDLDLKFGDTYTHAATAYNEALDAYKEDRFGPIHDFLEDLGYGALSLSTLEGYPLEPLPVTGEEYERMDGPGLVYYTQMYSGKLSSGNHFLMEYDFIRGTPRKLYIDGFLQSIYVS